jgi:hypothetical protein
MFQDKRVPSWVWEVAAALILLTWRLTWYPPSHYWNDWLIVLPLYWIFTSCAPKSRAWPAVTLLTILWLFVAYSLQHLPLTIDHLRFVL